MLHFLSNFDVKIFLFIFYDSFFKAMTFSECPEAVKEISDSLMFIFPELILSVSDFAVFNCLINAWKSEYVQSCLIEYSSVRIT